MVHFDVICDLLLNRRTATWNLFVKETHLLRKDLLKRSVLMAGKIKSSLLFENNVLKMSVAGNWG